MRRRRPEVLFVGSDATSTGASVMLLDFVRWLDRHTDLTYEVLLLDGGPLVDDFRALGPVRALSDLRDGRASRWLVRAGLHRLAALARALLARRWCFHLRSVPTLYCNGVTSIRAVPLLGRRDRLVISHVHELEGAMGVQGSAHDHELLASRVDRFVAASDLVMANLVNNHDIDPDRVVRHHGFFDVDAFLTQREEPATDLRAQLAIPEGAMVVGAIGVTPSLAMVLRRRALGRAVHLVWLSTSPTAFETQWLEFDIERAGLAGTVHLVGPRPRPAPLFELFDVFACTSRDDAFPLACLESSVLGTPVVCFDNTGTAEFVGDDECGIVVPCLDVEAMADSVERLLGEASLRAEIGDRAAARVRAFHDVSTGAPALFADLEEWRRCA